MFGNMSSFILTQNYIIFIDFFFSGIGSVSSYFLYLKLSMVVIIIIKKRKKDVKMNGKRFGHIWGPPSMP